MTKIRFTALNDKLKTVSAIAVFEKNKMVSFDAEKGTVRNLETVNLTEVEFANIANRFGVRKDFDL